jgi:sucrose-6-phosphate hydrolase SacC (GH32 family)
MLKSLDVWSTKVLVGSGHSLFNFKADKTIYSLNGQGLRWRRFHPFTFADPFLITDSQRLWLFVEQQRHHEHGKIIAYSTENLKTWVSHGVVLEASSHLSYPHVIESDGSYWMLPESIQSGKVTLYQADELPGPWRRAAELLPSAHADPTIFQHQGVWYLWATDLGNQLRLYSADQLQGPYREHPCSPLTSDLRYMRCGGRVQCLSDGSLVRLAQDSSEGYGKYLHAMSITQLTPDAYREELKQSDILSRGENWNKEGGHHLDSLQFNGKSILAVDGRISESAWNVPARIFWGLYRHFFG